MIKYLYWLMLWPFAFMVGLLGRILAPIVCMFIERKPRTDVVKRLGKRTVTLPRDSLVWWLTWFDTDDNATDEYWYGFYDENTTKTQEYYDTHRIYRWYCRVRWLNRNSMYTFNRKFFGLPVGHKYAWQYKKNLPLLFKYYNSVNIGFKSHKGFNRLMLAGRIIGIRKKKQ